MAHNRQPIFASSNLNFEKMKKLVLLSIVALSALAASAEIKYQSLDNIGGTNIVLTDSDAPEKVEISDAVFYCDGKEYRAKSIRCDVVDGVAKYKLKFKRLTVFKDCKVTLTVNGEKKTVNIQKPLLER